MNIQLELSKIYCALMKRTKLKNNKKSYESWLSKKYNNRPQVSFVIQSHNKSAQVKYLVRKLREYPEAEIVVIDDGSDLKHTRSLARFMTGANEFLIRSNDLYENVTYDKALRFANGRYVALLQDDDDFAGCGWIDEAVSLLESTPGLAILGGRDGLDFILDHANRMATDAPVAGLDQTTFQFVAHVNRAPMWINRPLFEEKLKHIDFSFAPFQYDDCELCLRAWLSGLKVGRYDARFTSLSAGGMRIWNSAFTLSQCERNGRKLYEMYKDQKEEVDARVAEARLARAASRSLPKEQPHRQQNEPSPNV